MNAYYLPIHLESTKIFYISTVRGHIRPEEAGKTLCHEHLSLEFTVSHSPNPDPLLRPRKDEVLGLENLWWINQNPLRFRLSILLILLQFFNNLKDEF